MAGVFVQGLHHISENLFGLLRHGTRWVNPTRNDAGSWSIWAKSPGFDAKSSAARRTVSKGEIARMLEAHRQWLESDKEEGQRASFRRTDLGGASLFDALLPHADLNRANLERANLRNADLREANLRHAQLQWADLRGTDLTRADLTDAKLTHAKLSDTTLREVTLRDADLTEVTGLLSEQLAGSDVSGASLPPSIAKFEGLAYVEALCEQSRNVFLALLGGCVFSWLTIGTTTDVNLLTNSVSSPLPIIQAPVPIILFYWTAPLILLGLYFYLHLYLQRIWEGLANLPAIFPDGYSLNERAYPWLLNSLARAHVALLKAENRSLSWLQVPVSIVCAWLLVPLTLLLFWIRFLPRHDWWGSVFLVSAFLCATWVGAAFYARARGTLRGSQPRSHYSFDLVKVAPMGALWMLMIAISWFAITSPYVSNANFREFDVTPKPESWAGGDQEARALTGASLNALDLRYLDGVRAFMAKADLRKANLRGANLKEANLRYAVLRKTVLRGAELVHADLSYAKLRKADLREADLEAANLTGAKLRGADLRDAVLVHANLSDAKLLKADLREADLEAANLSGAKLRGADLRDARNLTQEQLGKACGDAETRLPSGLSVKPCAEHGAIKTAQLAGGRLDFRMFSVTLTSAGNTTRLHSSTSAMPRVRSWPRLAIPR